MSAKWLDAILLPWWRLLHRVLRWLDLRWLICHTDAFWETISVDSIGLKVGQSALRSLLLLCKEVDAFCDALVAFKRLIVKELTHTFSNRLNLRHCLGEVLALDQLSFLVVVIQYVRWFNLLWCFFVNFVKVSLSTLLRNEPTLKHRLLRLLLRSRTIAFGRHWAPILSHA